MTTMFCVVLVPLISPRPTNKQVIFFDHIIPFISTHIKRNTKRAAHREWSSCNKVCMKK